MGIKLEEISACFHNLTDSDQKFESALKTSGDLFNNYTSVLNEVNINNRKLKSQIKEELLKLQGIKNAINERKKVNKSKRETIGD